MLESRWLLRWNKMSSDPLMNHHFIVYGRLILVVPTCVNVLVFEHVNGPHGYHHMHESHPSFWSCIHSNYVYDSIIYARVNVLVFEHVNALTSVTTCMSSVRAC